MNRALTFLTLVFMCSCAQPSEEKPTTEPVILPEGKLMIIGGGERTLELMRDICFHAGLAVGDSVGIFPMSSETPDSAFIWSSEKFIELGHPCINLDTDLPENRDGLEGKISRLKLVFISGGDQNRFMESARSSGLDLLLPKLYVDGLCISGTSAGAAVMSEIMLTGDQNFEPEYESTYRRLWAGNGVYAQGLGLLKGVIVDQHFIARSRYNRAFSALCDHQGHAVWGIDESTAAMVAGDSLTVLGSDQVIVFNPVSHCDTLQRRIGISKSEIQILLPGQSIKFR